MMTARMKIWSMAVAVLTMTATAGRAQTVTASQAAISGASAQRVGDDMVLTMDISLDAMTVKSNRSLVLTPVITSVDGQQWAAFRPVMVNGRRQHIMYERGAMDEKYPDALEFRRRNGRPQAVHYVGSVPYQTWMRGYSIAVAEDLCGCGDLLSQDQTPLLSKMPVPPAAPWLTLSPEVNVRKARQLEGKAYLDFPVNRTEIHPQYRRNPQELAKIVETINQVKQNKDVALDAISIHGYASPEGGYQNNARLAAGRAAALRNYVKGLFRFDDRIVSETSTPEDWDGLCDYLRGSDIANRDQLLAIATSELEPDARDAQMKRQFPEQYAYILKEVYPALRHSDYVVNYTIRPFDFEESKQIYRERPEDLSAYEIYRLAEDDGLDTPEGRGKLYAAARLYPTDSQALLLAAQAALQEGDADRAADYAVQAADMPQTAYVKGAIALRRADYAQAEEQMLKAREGGIAEAAAVLDIIKEYK